MPIRKPIDKVVGKAVGFIVGKAKVLIGKINGADKPKEEVPKNQSEHDIQVNAGLAALDSEQQKKDQDRNGALTLEEALGAAQKVKTVYPVFKSITPVKKGDRWVFEYVASPEKEHEGFKVEGSAKSKKEHEKDNLEQISKERSKKDKNEAENTTGKNLLPGEGVVGSYDDLDTLRRKGDNLTPYHMPSGEYIMSRGKDYGEGITMWIEQPHPGIGGRHRSTFTYGKKATSPEIQEYLKLSPRDALAFDIKEVRKIYMQEGLYTPEIRRSLMNVVRQNKEAFPDLFTKKPGNGG